MSLDIDSFVNKFLRSPITGKIYLNPVIQSNGELTECNLCDNDDFYSNVALKSFINCFLDTYPEYKEQVYQTTILKSHSANKNKVNNLLLKCTLEQLQKYDNFRLNLIDQNTIYIFISETSIDCLQYFMENTNDFSHKFPIYFIHLLCFYKGKTNPELVKYMIDKDNQMDLYSNINQIGEGSTLEIILAYTKDIDLQIYSINKHIEAGLPFDCSTQSNKNLVIRIFRCDIKVITYFLELFDRTNANFKEIVPLVINAIEGNNSLNDDSKTDIISLLF